MELLKKFWKEEDGQDMIEYALLAALVALAATAGMTVLATDINNGYNTIGGRVTTAVAS